jgi:hypothetical protein
MYIARGSLLKEMDTPSFLFAAPLLYINNKLAFHSDERIGMEEDH